MPKLSQTDDDSRERLLHEGLRLFMQHGYAAVSTREICAAAGVTQPSLYYHFGNKEGLYLATIIFWFDGVRTRIAEATAAGQSLHDRLHRIAAIFWSDQLGEYQAMQRDAIQQLPPDRQRQLYGAIWGSVIAPIVGLMQDAIQSGELPNDVSPFILTEFFWALIDGFTGVYHRGDPLPPPEQNDAVIAFFLAGVRATPPAVFAQWTKYQQGNHWPFGVNDIYSSDH